MQRHLILSNQQLITMLDRLGYQIRIKEEIQYCCGLDSSCEPIVVTTLKIQLPQHFFPSASENNDPVGKLDHYSLN